MPIPWRLVAYVAAVLALVGALWGFGHLRFEAGRNAERDLWTPRLLAAQKAAADANARTLTIESAQKIATSEAEARHAETIAALNTRAADAERRIRTLSVRITSGHSGGCDLSPVSGTAAQPDGEPAGGERAERAGSGIADIGRRCEADAASLHQLQQWVREQAKLNP